MEPDISQQVLAELQKLRRFAKRGLITFLVLFATFVAASVWHSPRDDAYADANRAVRALNYSRAIQIAEKIAADHPQDYTVHDYLGNLYVRSGDLAKAEAAYARSNALYPSEEITKILDSIRKSRSEDPPSPTPSVSSTPSARPTP